MLAMKVGPYCGANEQLSGSSNAAFSERENYVPRQKSHTLMGADCMLSCQLEHAIKRWRSDTLKNAMVFVLSTRQELQK